MTPADWDRLDALLDDALDLPRDAQTAYLDAQDLPPGLRQHAEAMLAADAESTSVLDAPERLGVLFDAATEADRDTIPPGTAIGPYRVVREIGQGGMGTVVLAERADGAFDKQVALKLVRPGLAGGVLARFRAERQILARLDHPGIARLLDGGQTDDGRPYLAMEYVDGEPITAYADRLGLDVDARLALFEQVCDAVAYAHRQLVVHRDLKPSNILVVSGEGARAKGEVAGPSSPLPLSSSPTVKLLDFGIAKLLEDDGSMVETVTEQRLLTPAYAAPEQVRGEPPSTATDVYALGVLLYELLTGRRPFAMEERARHAMERAILETEPTRPSTALTEADPATPAVEVAAARQTEPARLRRRLAGDLDQIVLMALRKEPERRYDSAAAFGRDVRRHLDRLPVEARPDSLRYRAGRFARRNRVGVTATLLGLLVSLFYVASLRVERDRAAAERDRAEVSLAYVQSLFAGADPSQRPRADTLLARHLLDAGAEGLADLRDPRVAAGLSHALGQAYYELALYGEAVSTLQRADSLYAAIRADTSRAAVLGLLGRTQQNLNQNEAAVTHYQQAHALRARGLGEAHPLTLLARVDLCNSLRYRTEPTALNACRDSLETLARPLTRDGAAPSPERYQLFYRIAELAFNVRDVPAVEPWSEARAAMAGPWSESPVARGWAASQDGALGMALGRPREGARHYETSREVWRSVYGPDHPLVLYARNNLAAALLQAGDASQAESLLRESVARFAAQGPMETVANAFIANGLWARALAQTGRLAEAEAVYAELLPLMTETWGPNNPFRLSYELDYARALAAADRPSDAEPLLEETVQRFGEHHPDHYAHGEALVMLASLREGTEADTLAHRGLEVLERTLPAGHWRIEQARQAVE
ncbi:MAG: serine/threonine-protein kinase [Bacteroidota bacterium]